MDILCRFFPFLLLVLLFFLVLLTMFAEVQMESLQFITTGANIIMHKGSRAGNDTGYSLDGNPRDNFVWGPPPPLRDDYTVIRDTQFGNTQLEHEWLQPLVFMAYVRRTKSLAPQTEVFLYMTGVSMGTFNRNFSVVGCLVGKDVYPILYSRLDVVFCEIDREVQGGEKLSVALFKDDTLEQAIRGPVELKPGLQVTFSPGDVYQLPEDSVVHLSNVAKTEDLMIVRSVVQASPSKISKDMLGNRPRYEVCMATQMKPYPYLLSDWIEYHRRLGVDMVYIMDNDGPEDLSAKFAGMNDVEVIYWPWARSQVQAWSWMLVAARSRCEWLLLTDADEYVMFGLGENMEHATKQPLRMFARRMRRSGYDEAFFQFVVMGNSGYIERPKKPLPEAFIHFKQYNNTNGKVLLRTDAEWMLSTVHSASGLGTMRTFRQRNTTIYPHSVEDVPRIVHYQFRSWEEFALKMRTGSGSIHDQQGVGGRDVAKQPGGYVNVRSEREYTHFRELYRAVTGAEWNRERKLVRKEGNVRCFVEIRVAQTVGEQMCEEDDGESVEGMLYSSEQEDEGMETA